MRILAFDTSGAVASVAILDDEKIIAQYSLNYNMTHSVTLMPMLESMISMLKIDLKQIDAIAIAAGPGSFTGLKIGSATVKALAYSLNKPIISVKTTMALAANLYLKDAIVCPIMDARRDRVYGGIYEFNEYRLNTVLEQEVYRIEDMIEKINTLGKQTVFLGDGVPVYKHVIDESCSVDYSYAPSHLYLQQAASVAVLAADLYERGVFETAVSHQPIYIRESSAVTKSKE